MSSTKKVVVTDYNFPNIDIEREIISKDVDADVSGFQSRSADDVCEVSDGADGLLVQFAPVTAEVIKRLNPGAAIVRYGVGYDNIDVKAATEHHIKVGYVPDYCVEEVAEHTVALLLSMLRKLPVLHQSIKNGYWQGVKKSGGIKPFKQTSIGFLGMGRIGRAVMERLRPFGFKFLINDPAVKPESAKEYGAELAEGAKFWQQADAITLHVPSTEQTRHIINKQVLSRMKESAIIINTSRGDLINSHALAEALQTGEIAGAALDVFETEPLPLDSIFLQTPNLLMTSHMAWFSDESMARLQTLAAQEMVRGLKGEPLRCPIN
jgi:D-3-phosphoglycerate dehydrogenase